MTNLKWVRRICSVFPPIISQKIRDRLIAIPVAEKLALDFKRRAFTGSYLKGNTSDFHAFKFLIHGYFDWRNIVLTRKILKVKAGDVVEVGANIGTETVSFADVNAKGKVHAFEPLPINFKSLQDIKSINNLNNLSLYNVLVSKEKGEAYFKIPAANSSGSGHIASKEEGQTQRFDVVTLDQQLEQMQACAAIVADVEGYEPQVLEGAEKILSTLRPYLILEVNAKFLKQRANSSIEAFYTQLEGYGYVPYYINRLGIQKVDAANFLVKSNKNWLCIPKEEVQHASKLSRTIALNAFNPWMRYIIF